MPLLAILSESAHGALDDSLKTLYKQNSDDKQFYLDIAPDEAAKVAFNLQSEKDKLATNNAELLKQKGEANAKLKAYEALGKSADELKIALESNRPEEVTKLVEKYENEKTTLKTSYDESLTAAQEKAKQLEQQVVNTLTQATISKLRAEHDLNDTADYVLQNFIRVEPKEEGSAEYTTRVYENGSPALVAGQPKTPEQLVKGFKEEKKFLSMFNAPNGGGTGGTNRQTNLNNNKSLEGLSPTEKLKLARENA